MGSNTLSYNDLYLLVQISPYFNFVIVRQNIDANN